MKQPTPSTAISRFLIAGIVALAAVVVLSLTGQLTRGSASAQAQQATGCNLYARWSMCAWSGPSGMPVDAAFAGNQSADGDISDRVTVVYTWLGAEQSWAAHFPQFANVPGANDFDTLNEGQAYWIGITDGPAVSWVHPTIIPDPTPVATATPTLAATATPTPTPTPSPTPTTPPSQGPWYTSAHASAQYYYCAADTWGWQSIAPANLREYPTEAELLAVWYGQRVKHHNSAC